MSLKIESRYGNDAKKVAIALLCQSNVKHYVLSVRLMPVQCIALHNNYYKLQTSKIFSILLNPNNQTKKPSTLKLKSFKSHLPMLAIFSKQKQTTQKGLCKMSPQGQTF